MISLKHGAAVAVFTLGVLVAPGVASAAGPLDGLTVPPADPSLTFVAPSSDQPNYDARLAAFVGATVPDTFDGQSVAFFSTFSDAGGADVLGLPTSMPKADPNNPQFIYQRFQNGVLFYNGSEGTTTVLPLS